MVEAPKAARGARAFHWPLEFPDVMQRGGFDVVLGNPPWDVVQLSEEEYFSTRIPEIGALSGAARKHAISELQASNSIAHAEYIADKRNFDASNEFARESGRFELSARGKINTYSLFSELFAGLARRRAGVIVPTGIATDATTAPFFASLVEGRRLSKLIDFENKNGIFTSVHRSYKFCLLTIGAEEDEAAFSFFLSDPSQINDIERNFTLSPEQISAINPITKNAPIFRARADAELAAKMFGLVAKIPRTEDWLILNQNVFTSSNSDDLEQFQNTPASTDTIAVFRGTFFNQYSVDPILGMHSNEDIQSGNVDASDKYVDREYYEQRIAKKFLNPKYHLSIRRIARATDSRTMIAAILPMVATDDTASVLSVQGKKEITSAVLANLNSICLDYTCGFKIGGTDIRKHNFSQLPVLPPDFYTEPRLAFITPKVLELTYTSHSLAPFARDLGHDGPPFAWDEDRRAHLRADLDAFYARAYGLTRDELRYILDPADVKGPDYPSETFRVLKDKEIRHHGEYRTRRLVLEAWDRMQQDGTFAALGMAETADGTMQQPIQLPPLEQLPDAVWARAVPSPQYDPSAALAAILKSLDGPTPIRTIRLTAAIMLEPHLLTPILSPEDQTQWRRLVGQEAEPRPGNVVGFSGRTTPGWNAAITNHRGNGRLLEDIGARTWTPGTGLEAFDTSGWPEGRARFVLDALRNLDIDATVNAAPAEVRDWIANAAAG